jgi:hypothetical protein
MRAQVLESNLQRSTRAHATGSRPSAVATSLRHHATTRRRPGSRRGGPRSRPGGCRRRSAPPPRCRGGVCPCRAARASMSRRYAAAAAGTSGRSPPGRGSRGRRRTRARTMAPGRARASIARQGRSGRDLVQRESGRRAPPATGRSTTRAVPRRSGRSLQECRGARASVELLPPPPIDARATQYAGPPAYRATASSPWMAPPPQKSRTAG